MFTRLTHGRWAGKHMRRAALVVGFMMSLAAGIFAFAAPASACDINTHCYGIAIYSNGSIKGTHATIAPSYLTSPSSNFVTDEVWLVDSTSQYWVEIGYIRNYANINGVSQGLSEFWFDSRPGGGAHGHVLVSNPSLSARTFYITQSSPSTTYGVGDGSLYAYSTSNSMVPATAEIGSETTSASACSWSNDSSMAYTTGFGWVNLPSAGTSVNSPQQLTWVSYPTNMNAGVKC